MGMPLAASGVQANGSKLADKDAAKEIVNQQRLRSVNSLHAVGRLLSDTDLRHHCNMVGLATAMWGAAHSEATKDLRGPEENRTFYSSWAHSSWLLPVKEMLRTCDDLEGLSKCGFNISMAAVMRQDQGVRDRLVRHENDAFSTYWKLLLELMKSRCGSMSLYSCSFPGLLAGLLHKDECKRTSSMVFVPETPSCVRRSIHNSSA